MADETDLDELARRYLDLWQDQMSALASDPEAAETLTRLMTVAGANASAAWAAWPAFMTGLGPAAPAGAGRDGKASEKDLHGAATEQAKGSAAASDRRSAAGRPASPGAAAAAAASGHGGLDLDGLASRLAELEDRVKALESSSRRGSGGASRRPRKGRS